MGNGVDKKSNTAKLRKWVYAVFVAFAVLLLAAVYCFASGRLLLGKDYWEYKEYQNKFRKYFLIEQVLEKEAIEYKSENGKLNQVELTDKDYEKLLTSFGDPYAEYFSKEEFESFERRFAESYDGIGVTIGDVTFKGESKIRVLVYSVFEDSPAELSGIKVGDLIESVDGEKIKNSDDACSHMLGQPGTDVSVTINRNGTLKTLDMERAKIEEKPVKYEKLDKKNKIGYIYVSTFKEGTFDAFKLAVKDLKNDGYEKMIIDLRNNGGGMTKEAYKLADYLLTEGIIVTEKTKSGKEGVRKSDASSASFEYVVLVNKLTASASEIVACAIQDNKGGKIIGTKTYGKGVTQKTQKLSDGSAIKFTIEEYYRPSGKKVNKVGVTPDIKINANDDDAIFNVAKQILIKGAN